MIPFTYGNFADTEAKASMSDHGDQHGGLDSGAKISAEPTQFHHPCPCREHAVPVREKPTARSLFRGSFESKWVALAQHTAHTGPALWHICNTSILIQSMLEGSRLRPYLFKLLLSCPSASTATTRMAHNRYNTKHNTKH